ncbi:MAG TPA: 3-ketoacyl-ACP reductase [Planctomycetaceae bacterium]|nr:3-ketoacyl-ACP reductase [Planctomycetaceae bacterium]
MTTKPVALVTGGGTGVGRATVLRFASAGYNVAINYSRSQADAESTASDAVELFGASTITIACDVSDESACRAMIDSIASKFGRLDTLVNNAAMTHFVPAANLEDMTEDKWDRILGVNLKGTFFCARAAAHLLKKSDNGSIINVSSVAGLTGSGSCIAYSASKAAINNLTKSLALALAPEIRVNAVLPGPIDSRWIRDGDNDWDLSEMTAGFPIPRASSPDEIADGIIFFATGTKMATGQLLAIDGGQTL